MLPRLGGVDKRFAVYFERPTDACSLGRVMDDPNPSAFEGIASMSDYVVAMDSRRDNVSDHRVRTIDLLFQKHAQAGLRVHRIVIHRRLDY